MAYQKPHQHVKNCPYSGNVPIIEYKDLETLRQSNTDLQLKIEKAQQAPEFTRDVFKELEQAEARVLGLEKLLEENYFDDKHNEAMTTQLQNTNKRIVELTDKVDEANRKNKILDRQVGEKKELEAKLSKAIANIGDMTRNLEAAKERSQDLEKNLREAKTREGELRSAKAKLRDMENELDGANRKLFRLEHELNTANDRWKTVPQDLTRVYVNPGTSGRVVRSSVDGLGRRIKGSEKVMVIADNRANHEQQRNLDYRLGRVDDRVLQRRMVQLKGEYAQNERENVDLMRENERMAAEVRIMKDAFEKMQHLDRNKKKRYTVQDMRSRVI